MPMQLRRTKPGAGKCHPFNMGFVSGHRSLSNDFPNQTTTIESTTLPLSLESPEGTSIDTTTPDLPVEVATQALPIADPKKVDGNETVPANCKSRGGKRSRPCCT